MFYISALVIFILDQFSKYYLSHALRPNQSLPVIKNVLHLTYVQNRGAAFGLFYGQQRLLILIGIALIGMILYFHFRIPSSNLIQILLGFILGGSLGNIFDRIFRHYVVDFIDFRFWPVFNLADTMINLGVFLIVLNLIFAKERG